MEIENTGGTKRVTGRPQPFRRWPKPLFGLLLVLLLGAGGAWLAWTQLLHPTQAGLSLTSQPLDDKLAAGLLQLEGSDTPLDADQARTLLPLWKAVKSLGSSSTASVSEVDALYQQIQETLTSDQLQMVKDLDLASDGVQTLLQRYGSQAGQAQSSGSTARQSNSQAGGAPGDGGGMGGPPPDAGGGLGTGVQAGAQATAVVRSVGGASVSDMNLIFVDALIQLLEARSAG